MYEGCFEDNHSAKEGVLELLRTQSEIAKSIASSIYMVVFLSRMHINCIPYARNGITANLV